MTRLSKVKHKGGSKGVWETVHQLNGRRMKTCFINGVTADSLNTHYASISMDPEYIEPHLKHTVNEPDVEYVSEWSMFNALDTLPTTATGFDEIPAWFLRLGAPVFAKPLAQLLNLSISTSIVPVLWKQECICQVPKTACPREHSNFCPVSITSVLSFIQSFRTSHHSTVPLSSLPSPTIFALPHRPTCVPPHRFNYYCSYLHF